MALKRASNLGRGDCRTQSGHLPEKRRGCIAARCRKQDRCREAACFAGAAIERVIVISVAGEANRRNRPVRQRIERHLRCVVCSGSMGKAEDKQAHGAKNAQRKSEPLRGFDHVPVSIGGEVARSACAHNAANSLLCRASDVAERDNKDGAKI